MLHLAPLAAALLSLLLFPGTAPREPGYVGSETCGQCHDEIHAIQSQTNMAQTWKSIDSGVFGGDYSKETREGLFRHRVFRQEGQLLYEIEGPGDQRIRVPVEVVTGGTRFGIGFLLRIREIDGQPLARPALIEARYMQGPNGELALAPGHAAFRPTSVQNALGRVLNEEFEVKCVTCHGSPAHQPTGEAGVQCENCHGPGRKHLNALETGSADLAIQNPAKLKPAAALQVCGKCHAGFSQARQPRPQDLLISDQVRALSLSECFVQSGGAFSCINCHNPHEDLKRDDPRYDQACLGCHSLEAKNAAACPVDRSSRCVSCHMPEIEQGDLKLRDHWIRVQDSRGARVFESAQIFPSRVKPRRLFLRELATQDRDAAEEALARLSRGTSFHDLAQEVSIAASAAFGGYLGEIQTDQLEIDLAEAALALRPGQHSSILGDSPPYKIIYRMPRDFRFQAIELSDRAADLTASGQLDDAISTLEKAVRADPHSIRALNALAVARARTGESEAAIASLRRSVQLDPEEPASCLLLGRVLGMAGKAEEHTKWSRRAVEQDPTSLEARLQLGGALFAAGNWAEATEQFQKAALINPLSAPAYFNLAQAQQRLGHPEEAQRLIKIAQSLEPRLRR